MRLADRDGGVLLTYEADATVTGPLAGVGQRLMGAAARRTTAQFLTALETTIVSPPAEEAAQATLAGEARGAEVVVAPRGGADTRVVVGSALAGFVLALIGVAVGRWTARH